MGESSLAKRYREYYDAASVFPQQLDTAEVERFVSLVPRSGPLDILDMGSAEGALAVRLARMGHRVVAADIAPRQLAKVAERARREKVAVRCVELDIEKSAAGKELGTFDVVYMMDVIEHLMNPVRGLENVRELVRETGVLILHTPNCCIPSGFLLYALNRHKRTDYFNPAHCGDFHFQTYDYLTLKKTLNFVGLRPVRVVPTVLTPPVLHRFGVLRPLFRGLARVWPLLADTLLLVCARCAPLDVDRQIDYWKHVLPTDSAAGTQ